MTFSGLKKTAIAIIGLVLAGSAIMGPQPVLAGAYDRGPEAAKALNLGLKSAARGKYDQAIAYFEKARERSPHNPTVLFNLALATDRKSNRELIALSWYQAYLAAAPDDLQARRARRRVAVLEAEVRAKIGVLLSKSQQAAQAGITDLEFIGYARLIENAYFHLGLGMAASGDMTGALAVLQKVMNPARIIEWRLAAAKVLMIVGDYRQAASCLLEARRLLKKQSRKTRQRFAGDLDALAMKLIEPLLLENGEQAAQKLAAGLRSSIDRDRALGWVIHAKIDRGDLKGAANLTRSLSRPSERAYLNCARAVAMAERGEVSQAMDIALKSEKLIGSDALYYCQYISMAAYQNGDKGAAMRIMDDLTRSALKELAKTPPPVVWRFRPLIESYVKMDNLRRARQVLDRLYKNLDRWENQQYLAMDVAELARLQELAGDIEAAKHTLKRLPKSVKPAYKKKLEEGLLCNRAEGEAWSGRPNQALKTAAKIQSLQNRFNAWSVVCNKFAQDNDPGGMYRVARQMKPYFEQLSKESGWKWLTELMAKSGLVSVARDMAAELESPSARYDAYRLIAQKQMLAGDLTGARISCQLAYEEVRPREIDAWAETARKRLRQTSVNDWPSVMSSLRKSAPVRVVGQLAIAAGELAVGYDIYSQTKAEWGSRKPTTGAF